jgi:hypothetical protein
MSFSRRFLQLPVTDHFVRMQEFDDFTVQRLGQHHGSVRFRWPPHVHLDRE